MSVRNDILSGLKTALEALKDNTDYESPIRHISEFDVPVSQLHDSQVPTIIAIDTGAEELLVRDSTHYRYGMDVTLRGYVRSNTNASLTEDLNNMISTIKQFIDSDPSIDTAVKDFQYLSSQVNRFKTDDTARPQADVIINTRIIYVCPSGGF